jgi:catechol 2,3-dioxygenase-like lactoylglutathione lyase family enzyme
MTQAILEHVNITVSDPKATAEMLCALFDWQIRWSGEAKDGGVSYHVGGTDSYVAVFSKGGAAKLGDSYSTPGALNHIGVVVADIDATEARVRAAGFTPNSHADYEPGKRFYFDGHDGVEIEVVSYQK